MDTSYTLATARLAGLFFLLGLLAAGARSQTLIASAADGATVYSGTSGLCLGCAVSDEPNVVDEDQENYATISVPVGALGSAYLGVRISSALSGRWRVGFLVEEANGLLDAQVLERLALRTYLDGDLQSTAASPLAIRLSLLDTQRGIVSFVTERPFDELRISVGGVAGVLSNLRVLLAGARETTEPSFDVTFALAEDGATVYDGQGGVCLGCTVSDEDRVIDASFDNAALISVPVGVTGSAHLGVTFADEQAVPSFAGFIIRNTTALTDGQLLGQLRITTYLDGQQQETFSGGPFLSIQLLDASGRKRVGFRATEPFDELRVGVSGLVSVGVQVRVVLAGSAVRSEGRLAGDAAMGVDPAYRLFVEAVSEVPPAQAASESAAALTAAYPNPTRGSASFSLTVRESQHVRLAVYDVTGRRVAVVLEGLVTAGTSHAFRFDGTSLPAGTYLLRAEGRTFQLTRRLLLVE
jgi:hypothetical protein